MCTMLPPQYCGKTVTPRFLRHFNTISIDEFSNDTLKSIFSKIVLWHLDARYDFTTKTKTTKQLF